MSNYTSLQHKLQSYFKFKYLMLLLIVAFFLRHGMRVDIHVGDKATSIPVNVSPKNQRAKHAPQVKLASLTNKTHPITHNAAQLRKDYVKAFAPIAKAEMKAYGIPASITLAQGLLESVAGTSKLATRTNNHFGIKCFKRSCKRGHCHNFEDDHHKDFFRNYQNAADSYRSHSEFLMQGSRYKKLFKLSSKDYKGWAKGLSKAGYATDPKYADKLISLIERYKLTKYD